MTLISRQSAIFTARWSIDTDMREKSEVARTRVPISSEYSTGRIDGPPANGRSLSRVLAGVPVTKRATLIAPTLSAALCNFANDPEARIRTPARSPTGVLLKKNGLQFSIVVINGNIIWILLIQLAQFKKFYQGFELHRDSIIFLNTLIAIVF